MAERGRRARTAGPRRLDRRGVTPAVAKSLEIGMVVLFVGLLTTVLLGGVIPDYRRGADARVGDRVLATAGAEIESAVPPTARSVSSRHRVDLPARIGGQGYALRIDGRELVLDHPDPAVSGRIRLAMPPRVDSVDGSWESGAQPVVVVSGDASDLEVRLIDGGGR